MLYTTVQVLGQARLADLHRQAEREALARAARRAWRPTSTDRPRRLLAALTRRGRRGGEPVLAPPRVYPSAPADRVGPRR